MTGSWRMAVLLALWGSILSGCQPQSNEQGNPPRSPRQAAGVDDERTQDGHRPDHRPAKRAEGREAGGRSAVTRLQARTRKATDHDSVLSQSDAIQRALDIIRDSVDFAPTTVVWLVDISPSAMSWGSEIHSDVRRFYAEVVPTLTAEPDRLQTGVMTISRTVEFRVKRTTDPQAVVAAWDAMRIESSGREITFEAVKQALDEYLPQRIRERREVVFVIITDEAGDDGVQVDRLVEQPGKYALPVYVVGVPAPLGRTAALDPGIESSTEGPTLERQWGERLSGNRFCKVRNREQERRSSWSLRSSLPAWSCSIPGSVRLRWSGCAERVEDHFWRRAGGASDPASPTRGDSNGRRWMLENSTHRSCVRTRRTGWTKHRIRTYCRAMPRAVRSTMPHDCRGRRFCGTRSFVLKSATKPT